MKHRHVNLLFALLAACAGTAARQQTLLPAIASTWAHIRVQVVREAAAADYVGIEAALAAADKALEIRDPVTIAAVNWGLLEVAAAADTERRLTAGEIGPLVAESLRGRLADFTHARNLYLRQP
jgi:hypothetical protein